MLAAGVRRASQADVLRSEDLVRWRWFREGAERSEEAAEWAGAGGHVWGCEGKQFRLCSGTGQP